jgi:hypothetical protein
MIIEPAMTAMSGITKTKNDKDVSSSNVDNNDVCDKN